MNPIIFECEPDKFEEADILLNEMEFKEKPKFNAAEIRCNGKVYKYKIIKEFNHWYFVSDY